MYSNPTLFRTFIRGGRRSFGSCICPKQVLRQVVGLNKGFILSRKIDGLSDDMPQFPREEVYLPKYFNKDDPNQWQNKGSVTVMDVAEEDVRKRLDSFIPSEITKEQNELLLPYIHENYRESI